MAAIKETIFTKSGLILSRLIGRKSIRKGEKRATKNNHTTEEVEKVNKRNSERTLQIKLHNNFEPGDHHDVLTYRGIVPTVEEAQQYLTDFREAMRKEYKRLGLPFKWIMVTEYKNKRIHHHIVINKGVPIERIRELWIHGQIHDRRLSKSGDWRKLGSYLIKETDKTFRDPDAPSKLRYSCSRNLIMPEVYREEINNSELLDDPTPIKGYYIDTDSIYKGINPVTERPYVEYAMLPIDQHKLRKRFNGKKKSKYKHESFDKWIRENSPRQMEMDIPF